MSQLLKKVFAGDWDQRLMIKNLDNGKEFMLKVMIEKGLLRKAPWFDYNWIIRKLCGNQIKPLL